MLDSVVLEAGSGSVHRKIHTTMNLSTHKIDGDRGWVVR